MYVQLCLMYVQLCVMYVQLYVGMKHWNAFFCIYNDYCYVRKSIYIFGISGRFDVGNLPSYVICNEKYKPLNKKN